MKTIYDIGFHTGQDTEYYLALGFQVVAVDANPKLIDQGVERFATHIDAGQLTLLNAGVSIDEGDFVFYVNDEHSEYSSFNKGIASRSTASIHEIVVQTRTLESLLLEHGPAHYVKIDIEGYDHLAIESLTPANSPRLISIENGFERDLERLRSLGFVEFNFVDQSRIAGLELKSSAEGHLDSWTFEYGASGPFGGDILNSPWESYEGVLSRVRSHWNRSEVDPITDGWFDLHARRENSQKREIK